MLGNIAKRDGRQMDLNKGVLQDLRRHDAELHVSLSGRLPNAPCTSEGSYSKKSSIKIKYD